MLLFLFYCNSFVKVIGCCSLLLFVSLLSLLSICYQFVSLLSLLSIYYHLVTSYLLQKQEAVMFYKKSCSSKFRNIHWKPPVYESISNKVADLRTAILLKRESNSGVSYEYCKIFGCFEVVFIRMISCRIDESSNIRSNGNTIKNWLSLIFTDFIKFFDLINF